MATKHLAPLALAGCGLVALLLRLPFLTTGIGPDEGGYAYVAERWAHGAKLYSQVWIDRPQGLLLAYRALLGIADKPWAIRLGAALFGAATTLLVGAIGWLLRGPVAGVAAAAVYAIAGVAPHLEGFTFNGELAAAMPASGAVAAALAWRRSGRTPWLLLAGLSGSVAVLLKQSGFDGLVVALAVVLAYGAGRRIRLAGIVLGAAAIPLTASALDGLEVGWHAYWSDVVGYRVGAGVSLPRRIAAFRATLPRAESDLDGVAAVAITGLLRPSRFCWIPALWLAVALCGFNLGGSYWPHYYVQLLAPLAVLAGVAAASLPRPGVRAVAVAACVLPVAVFLVRLVPMSQAQREQAIPYYATSETDARVAALVRARTSPRTPIYVLASRADLYFLADRRADFPYLWGHPLHEIPKALAKLRALLAGPDRPPWIFVYQPADKVDRTGALDRVLDRWYRFRGDVPRTSVGILRTVS
jgi:4-amino-4-deoxy-L-arabinose transferase-like glycosyltransferase